MGDKGTPEPSSLEEGPAWESQHNSGRQGFGGTWSGCWNPRDIRQKLVVLPLGLSAPSPRTHLCCPRLSLSPSVPDTTPPFTRPRL